MSTLGTLGTEPAASDPAVPRAVSDTSFAPLAVGAGGFVTGLSFSDDGATRLIRTDGFGGYRWDGERWDLNVSAESLPAADVVPGLGGGVLAVAVAPSDASIAYMAFNHSVYRSTDGAKTWKKILTGVSTAPNDSFRVFGSRLAVDPTNPEVVYYGTQLDGLYLTRNGGTSWTQIPTDTLPAGILIDINDPATRGDVTRPTDVLAKPTHLAGAGISAIAIDKTGPIEDGRSQVLYAASYGEGVYRSPDAGRTWSKISPPTISGVGYLQVLSNGDVLLTSHSEPTDLTSASDVWRYSHGKWTTSGPTRQENWRSIAADPTHPGDLALMAPGGRLALSTDNGLTWSVLQRTQDSTNDVPWLSWALNGGTNYMSLGQITYDPLVPRRLWFAEGTGVWYADLEPGSTQVHWKAQSRGIEQLVPTGVIAPPGGKPLLTAWDRPIFRSEDPQTYPDHYGPVNAFSSAWSIDYSVSDPNYIVASVASHQWPSDPSTSGYSTDGGHSWKRFPTIPQSSTNAVTTFGFGAIAVSDPGNIVWVPAYGKRPEYTQDGGTTWKPITLPGLSTYSLINSKAYYVNRQILTADKTTPGTFYLYVANTGTYRTTDGATTWTLMSDNTAMRNTDWNYNVTLKAVPGHTGELYITPGKLAGTTTQPFKHSTDAGTTWTTVPHLTGVTAFGYGKAFPHQDHPTIYAAGYYNTTYGLYRSTDNATTWTYLTDYPTGRTPPITAIDGDKNITGRVYTAIAGSGWTYGTMDTPPR